MSTERRHPPSAKGLQEARRLGDLPRSPLLTRAASLFGGLLGLWWCAPRIIELFVSAPFMGWQEHLALSALLQSLLVLLLCAVLSAYLVGSLAGGFLFSFGALRRRGGLSLPQLDALVSAVLALSLFALALWRASRWLSAFSWAPAAPEASLFAQALSLSLRQLVVFLGAALLCGVVQAIFSWWRWRTRHQRSTQTLRQDLKDEASQARRFFSAVLAEQKTRDG